MRDRFGISPSVFKDYVFFKRKDSWRILHRSDHLERAARYKVEVVGIKAFHAINDFIKPTTRLIQLFGHLATRAWIEVSQEELKRLVSGKEIELVSDMEDGYVILRFQGNPVGLGLLIRGRLKSQIPKKEARFFT
jgi:NOL1/NOP2/fmu family ribosome biogenesis protein